MNGKDPPWARGPALHALQRRVQTSQNGLRDHLHSILEDAELVQQMREFLKHSEMPVFANKRNGCWYGEFDRFCYFKSTDGHDRNLLFNYTSRLNLDVAERAIQAGGCLIIDSTRAGKTWPDSMRNTIPIWCSVLNHVAGLDSPSGVPGVVEFHALPSVTAPVHAQRIASEVIPSMVAGIPQEVVEMLRARLGGRMDRHDGGLAGGERGSAWKGKPKPLVPVWVHPDEDGVLEWSGAHADVVLEHLGQLHSRDEADGPARDLDITPVLLLSCSGAKKARHVSEQSWEYIQGAGDDEETWAEGLTADVFWRHSSRIMAAWDSAGAWGEGGAVGMSRMVKDVLQEDGVRKLSGAGDGRRASHYFPVRGTALALSREVVRSCGGDRWDGVINVISGPGDREGEGDSRTLHVSAQFSKQECSGSRGKWAATIIPRVLAWYRGIDCTEEGRAEREGARVLVVCGDGSDETHSLSAVVLLVLLLEFYEASGGALKRKLQFSYGENDQGTARMCWSSKESMKVMVALLQSLCEGLPAAWNPPRRLLKEVQAYFVET